MIVVTSCGCTMTARQLIDYKAMLAMTVEPIKTKPMP